jgi:membrane-associated protease RseP (regulator of RpoE activity)
MMKSVHADCLMLPLLVLGLLVSYMVSAEERGAPSLSPVSQLGISAEEVPFAELAGMGLQYGVRVTEVVPGRAAARAGLRPGDIIEAINDKPAYTVKRLEWLVAGAESGEVDVTYLRNGRRTTVTAGLEGPNGPSSSELWQAGRPAGSYLGVQLQNMTDELREVFKAPEGQGVLIVKVAEDSPAAKGGLQVGDVIAQMGRKAIHDRVDVLRGLDFYEPGETVELDIVRDKVHQTLGVVLAEPLAANEPGVSAERVPVLPLPDPRLWREPLEGLMQELMHRWKELLRELEEVPSGQAQDYL